MPTVTPSTAMNTSLGLRLRNQCLFAQVGFADVASYVIFVRGTLAPSDIERALGGCVGRVPVAETVELSTVLILWDIIQ